jgi:cellulose synthase (UDP-forming)
MVEEPFRSGDRRLSRCALERKMTPAGPRPEIVAGKKLFSRIARMVFLLLVGGTFLFLAAVPLDWQQQAVMGLLVVGIALAMAAATDSSLVTLILIILSMFATFRYGYWRVVQVGNFLRDAAHPFHIWTAVDAFFIVGLLGAEAFTFGILFLGYLQTIWPLRRAPAALPEDPEEWPHIDVLIPTLNEPLEVVRFTALGALNMDWPAEKLHVYILDDGLRSELEQFAADASIGYRTRAGSEDAKAGNLNAALKSTNSPLVVVFDCDHVPTRSFLQMTAGWFLRDPKLAILQTPHHFYSPDPFERNLGQFRVVPNEAELFYRIVQDGNDLWNASFFCGSCAMLRRAALDEVGGFAVETVTEDAHTSLRLQKKGWNSAYINIPQAAGLAAETLSAYVEQRKRWARGMIQILRLENPLFALELKLPQRLCYFNSMCHFLFAIPRLIFLTAPLIFLLFGLTNFPGYWLAIVFYALPHLVLAITTNSRLQGAHRFSFWNEIYETALAPHLVWPAVTALVNPRKGKFIATPKGGAVMNAFFDARTAAPLLALLALNLAGLAMAIPRFLVWDRPRPGAVAMNLIWCCFNIMILGVSTAVARETRQLRTTSRLNVATPVELKLPGGRLAACETVNLSIGGASVNLGEAMEIEPGNWVRLAFPIPLMEMDLAAEVVAVQGLVLHLRFGRLSIAEQEVLTTVLYSPADSWLGWGETRKNDNALRSLGYIFKLSMRGMGSTLGVLLDQGLKKAKGLITASAARSSGILLLAALAAHAAVAQPAAPAPIPGPHTVAHLEVHFIQVGWWSEIALLLARAPWEGSIVAVGTAFLLALWMRAWLRELAQSRLNP